MSDSEQGRNVESPAQISLERIVYKGYFTQKRGRQQAPQGVQVFLIVTHGAVQPVDDPARHRQVVVANGGEGKQGMVETAQFGPTTMMTGMFSCLTQSDSRCLRSGRNQPPPPTTTSSAPACSIWRSPSDNPSG